MEFFSLGVISIGGAELKDLSIINIVMLTLTVWLYKEFKAQYQKDKELKAIKAEKLRTKINNSLFIASQYKSGNNQDKYEEFYSIIYECFSFWNTSDIEEVRAIINNYSNDLSEKDKIDLISRKLYNQLVSINKQNKGSNFDESSYSFLKNFTEKISGVFIPLFPTAVVILILSGLSLCIIEILLRSI